MVFTFDKKLQKYRQNGKFISPQKIREIADQAIEIKKKKAAIYTQDLLRKKISVADWEKLMAHDLKTLSIQLYKLGKAELNQSDHGKIGAILRQQYRYLNDFAIELAIGKKMSRKQVLARTNLYFNQTRGLFNEGMRQGHQSVGVQWERRVLGIAEHCQDCPGYAALGWQRIGILPRPTERCQCRSNCKCSLEFSFSPTQPPDTIKLNSFKGILENGYYKGYYKRRLIDYVKG